jgi:transposase-like protein
VKRGPKSKLTRALLEEFLVVIREGGTLQAAAEAVGVSRESVRLWVRKGKLEPDTIFAELAERLEIAKMSRRDKWMQEVAEGVDTRGNPDWRSRAWLLERLHANEFSRRTIKETVVRAEVEQILDQVEPYMSKAAYQELLHALERVVGLAEEEAPPSREGKSVH